MTDNKKRGQHYNPRFYLKYFSSENNGEYYIWCFDKEAGKSFKTNINNIGKENWFYTRNDLYEETLSILDGYHSTVYRIIETAPIYSLIEQEKRIIAEFIYLTAARTRKAREDTLVVNQDVLHNNKFRKEFQYVFPGKVIEEELEGLKRNIQLSNMFDVKILYNNPNASELIDKIMSFDLFILKNEIGTEFCTSDHPISCFDLTNEEGFKVVFPLSPEQCLVIYNDKEWLEAFPTQRILVNEWFVKYANEKMIQTAHKFIYSRSSNFGFVRKFMENQKK